MTYRPLYHFSPPQGWTNDPNGLLYHDGLWHLFYQHEPVELRPQSIHWGHAVSRDLTHWEHWPIALYPNELGAIWSGSAAVTPDGELVACFTQNGSSLGQIQGIAFSNDGGHVWRMHEGNPVLTSDRPDFRDPKIFRHKDQWIMVVSGGHEAQFYSSTNLLDWTLLSVLPSPQPHWVWECPDLFQLNGQWVLIVSFIIPGSPVADGSRTHYWLGEFDGVSFTPHSPPRVLSFGPDDYAAIAWSNAPDGRIIIVGWMSHWNYAHLTPTADENWRGCMTLPRELTLREGVLFQTPPAELKAMRGAAIAFDESSLAFAGETYELEAEIDISDCHATVGFRLRVGQDEATVISYDPVAKVLSIDRTRSGHREFSPEFPGIWSAPLYVTDGMLKLRIFVDRCSVEVFAQDGELYGGALIFPIGDSPGIEFFGAGARIRKGFIYTT